ncbi:MAG: MoaD/ThiS family protein [Candidatus Neomarinimicrobiota bacterium]
MPKKVISYKVLMFSHLKYALGEGEIVVELNTGSTTADLVVQVRERLEKRLAGIPLRVAINGAFVTDDTVLQDGDEVALIPPVQGG